MQNRTKRTCLAPVATVGARLATANVSPAPSVHWAAIIDYNLRDGGSAYEGMVSESLASTFGLLKFTLDFRRWGSLKFVAAPLEFARARHFLKNCPDESVVVKTLVATLLNPRRQVPSIVILHHVGSSTNWFYSRLEPYILRQLRQVNAVVVVSEYWKRFLLEQGLTNVHTIYNAFRINEFEFTGQEIEGFKRRYNLLGKPIIYLGNRSPGKGVDETFESLKDLDVHLIASGHAGTGHNSIKSLFLEREDYLLLLASSTLAIAMSQAAEGWCRSAHEAMLCGTPVLGSGIGGMRELLESGGQIVCHDFCSLRRSVEALLASEERRSELGREGREFARQFTYERFQAEWVDLVNKVRIARPSGSPSYGTRGLSITTASERSSSSEIAPC